MPKVTGPAISLDAKGRFGKKLIFQKRPSGSVIYPFSKPGSRVKKNKEPSASQQIIRGYVKEAVAKWHQLTTAERKQWNDWVKEH